jgi:CheY-like chemotaxis protein
VRADDGPSALDALQELTLRGEQIALLLADHRMPGMTGIDFLEQAMDLAPGAKRVLLTAYADTDAAIRPSTTSTSTGTCSSRGTRRRSGCTRRSTSC